MADTKFTLVAKAVSLSAGVAKTVLQAAAPANQRVKILEIALGFHGVVNTNESVTVEVVRQTTAGTMSSVTPSMTDDDLPETIQTVGLKDASAEPTTGATLLVWPIHPQSGQVYQVPKADEVRIKGGGRAGIRMTAPQSVVVDVYAKFEE